MHSFVLTDVLSLQVAPYYVLQHRTLSTRLRSHDGDLWQIDWVLHLTILLVPPVCGFGGLRTRTPTVVKTSWSLLTSVMRPGSFTLILHVC